MKKITVPQIYQSTGWMRRDKKINLEGMPNPRQCEAPDRNLFISSEHFHFGFSQTPLFDYILSSFRCCVTPPETLPESVQLPIFEKKKRCTSYLEPITMEHSHFRCQLKGSRCSQKLQHSFSVMHSAQFRVTEEVELVYEEKARRACRAEKLSVLSVSGFILIRGRSWKS